MNKRKTPLKGLFELFGLLCVVLLASCSSQSEDLRTGEPQISNADDGAVEIVARAQTTNGTSVVIDSSTLDERGYVAIYSSTNGAPAQIIGSSETLDAGTIADIEISLDTPLAESDSVFAMLHYESNGNSTLDFPDGDDPVSSTSGVVAVLIDLELE